MRIPLAVSVLTLSMFFGSPSFAADDAGKQAFNNNCRTCHSWKEGDNRLGPNLHGVVGRKAGSIPDFAYSESMKSSGITWDEASLDKFITNPDSVVPNNKMKPFTGVGDAGTRKQIIDFLKTNPD